MDPNQPESSGSPHASEPSFSPDDIMDFRLDPSDPLSYLLDPEIAYTLLAETRIKLPGTYLSSLMEQTCWSLLYLLGHPLQEVQSSNKPNQRKKWIKARLHPFPCQILCTPYPYLRNKMILH